jgi:hypothetical protein
MCALVGRSYDKVSCVALSMANPDLDVRLEGYAAALLAATTKPHYAFLQPLVPKCTVWGHKF